MFNARPIETPHLQEALDEVKEIFARYDLAGACMLVAEDEAAYTYGMHAGWSALQPDPDAPLGFRLTTRGRATADERRQSLTGALHTICQLADFGAQTTAWMDDLKRMVRAAGIDFEHTSFGGRALPSLEDRAG